MFTVQQQFFKILIGAVTVSTYLNVPYLLVTDPTPYSKARFIRICEKKQIRAPIGTTRTGLSNIYRTATVSLNLSRCSVVGYPVPPERSLQISVGDP
jgi:hypothetical protein